MESGRKRPLFQLLSPFLASNSPPLQDVSNSIQWQHEANFLSWEQPRGLAKLPRDRARSGLELRAVQNGLEPSDWKPMKTIGEGVREIRIKQSAGAYRIVYLATLPDHVLVLHAFQKKTQQTAQRDIDLAIKRLKIWRSQQ